MPRTSRSRPAARPRCSAQKAIRIAEGRWRLPALLLLAALTLAVLWASEPDAGDGDPPTTTAGPSTSAAESATTAPPGTTTTATTTVDPTAAVSTDAFTVAPGGTGVVGTTGPLSTYTVEVEDGVPIDPAAFAAAVDATLADRRGWTSTGDARLQRVGPGIEPTFRVRLATAPTVDAHCAPLDTAGRFSCRNGADVMINLARWVEGAAPSGLPLAEYRHYVISHEVGHALGHEHVGCPAPGALAPVMLQQTKGLQGCAPNPWPFPGAP